MGKNVLRTELLETDTLFGLHVFSDNMSMNQLLLLLRALHFAKIPKQNAEAPKDQLHKVRSKLISSMHNYLKYITQDERLDESMIVWHE
ncbi:hypothetical protein X975_17413, partial [Stegodyphus mimosarum]